jgi:predicted dehydrogenase
MINLLLIGLGPHARRIYYPISAKNGIKNDFRIVQAIDLESKKDDISGFFKLNGFDPIDVTYLRDDQKCFKCLKLEVISILDRIVKEKQIHGVIISTEPLAHVCYAEWALSRGLSVLMDKPVSTREDVVNSLNAVEGLLDDYKRLERAYLMAKRKNPKITFSLMAQRRYHPAFLKIKELIKEVFEKTNCPITSLQSFHSDGQWRMPSEIVDQVYHPYCQGYGKCSHSGYHSIDIAPWLLEATETKGKEINNVDVFSNFLYPRDFLSQMNLADYKKFFPDFDKFNKYGSRELLKKYKKYGEIDAFLSFKFKHNKETITLGSANLVHNGFAQRNWPTAKGRDLYKGNGRVRHESHYIEQGPFQAISYVSYQGKEVNPKNLKGIYDVGGEYHLDIHIFRNQKMFPEWKNYQKYSVKDLGANIMEGKSRGHQEDARRRCVLEFVKAIHRGTEVASDFLDHKRSTMLFYAAYKSAALRKLGKDPVVSIPF